MAVIENGFFRGQIGNLVNRKVGNQNIVQTKSSHKTRQTQWTKAAASDFGKASKAGAMIRQAFILAHQKMHDGLMHTWLVKYLQRVLRANGTADMGDLRIKNGNINRLVGFQFNEQSHIYDALYFDPQVSFEKGLVTINLPRFNKHTNLFRPKNCSHINLRFETIGFNFGRQYFESLGTHEIDIDMSTNNEAINTSETLTFDSKGQQYDSIITVCAVLYLNKNTNYSILINDINLNPVGIIAAFNP
ncbi:hypothetical protein [Sphingobacterium sp. LRF_L2]|uniref:hypothetical protein n=1 Tax=Sphingobacterium sp. LRF_L2 TaxID=3369421 RepID=UPI003F5E281F